MLIAEYDYDMDIEVQREEAYAEGKADGLQLGREQTLVEKVRKKLSKGQKPEEIADALEESIEEIERIIKVLDNPDSGNDIR